MTDPSELYSQKPQQRSPKELDERILAAAKIQAGENAKKQARNGWGWLSAGATMAVLVIGFTFVFDFNMFTQDEFSPETVDSTPTESRSSQDETQQDIGLDTYAEEETAVSQMEEIIVTGRRREQSFQDTLVSIFEEAEASLGRVVGEQEASEPNEPVVAAPPQNEPTPDTPDEASVLLESELARYREDLSRADEESNFSLSSAASKSETTPLAAAAPVRRLSREIDDTSTLADSEFTAQGALVFSNNSQLSEEGLMNPNLLDVSSVIPDLILDIRYAGTDNFIGESIDGYQSATALLTPDAIIALARVQERLRPQGLTLKVFDAYRPQRAVDHFIHWSQDETNQATKSIYYPNIAKSELFALGYLAERSSHSRGSTVDLTIARVNDDGTHQELDMGTVFDFFDPSSWPESSAVSETAQHNRRMLKDLMVEQGFEPFETEWWHFTLAKEPYPNQYFDIVVE